VYNVRVDMSEGKRFAAEVLLLALSPFARGETWFDNVVVRDLQDVRPSVGVWSNRDTASWQADGSYQAVSSTDSAPLTFTPASQSAMPAQEATLESTVRFRAFSPAELQGVSVVGANAAVTVVRETDGSLAYCGVVDGRWVPLAGATPDLSSFTDVSMRIRHEGTQTLVTYRVRPEGGAWSELSFGSDAQGPVTDIPTTVDDRLKSASATVVGTGGLKSLSARRGAYGVAIDSDSNRYADLANVPVSVTVDKAYSWTLPLAIARYSQVQDTSVPRKLTIANAAELNAAGLAVSNDLGVTVMPDVSGGSGTVEDPWRICCEKDLLALRKGVAAGVFGVNGREHFRQDADIALSDGTFYGIGTEEHPFSGTYLGNGRCISNVTFQAIGCPDVNGLFRVVTNATISGLAVDVNRYVNGDGAAVVGKARAGTRIVGCESRGHLHFADGAPGDGAYAGICHLVEHPAVTIENCINRADVKTRNLIAGGIVGKALNGTATDTLVLRGCSNYGSISVSPGENAGAGAGGILAYEAANVLIDRCSNFGRVQAAAAAHAGAIVGNHSSGFSFTVTDGAMVTNGLAVGPISKSVVAGVDFVDLRRASRDGAAPFAVLGPGCDLVVTRPNAASFVFTAENARVGDSFTVDTAYGAHEGSVTTTVPAAEVRVSSVGTTRTRYALAFRDILVALQAGAGVATATSDGQTEVRAPAGTPFTVRLVPAAGLVVPLYTWRYGQGATVVTNAYAYAVPSTNATWTFTAAEANLSDSSAKAVTEALCDVMAGSSARSRVRALCGAQGESAHAVAAWFAKHSLGPKTIEASDFVTSSFKLDVSPLTGDETVETTDFALTADGPRLRVALDGRPLTAVGLAEMINRSADLKAWGPCAATVDGSGVVTVAVPAGQGKAFYRIVIPRDAP